MKKTIIIISIIVLLVILSIATIFIINKLNNKTNLTEKEVIEYLEQKNFEFEALKLDATKTYYICVTNTEEEIYFCKMEDDFMGEHYFWRNKKINNERADIKNIEENKKNEEKEQYTEFLKWLDKIGLEDTQIINVLDYYNKNTKIYKSMD